MTAYNQWLFVSDVDDTLLGDDEGLLHLAQALQNASDGLITAYNSSRPCASLRQTLAVEPNLPTPNYLIGALGTEIQEGASGRLLADYVQHLSTGWNRREVAMIMAELGYQAHTAEYQTSFKASYDVPNRAAHKQALANLETAGLNVKVIFSGGKNLDIIPHPAGKGAAIAYLRRRLDIAPERVVVAGDSGNDLEMFVAPYRGIVVANADPELKKRQGNHIYHAHSACAEGVLEGLRFWQVLG